MMCVVYRNNAFEYFLIVRAVAVCSWAELTELIHHRATRTNQYHHNWNISTKNYSFLYRNNFSFHVFAALELQIKKKIYTRKPDENVFEDMKMRFQEKNATSYNHSTFTYSLALESILGFNVYWTVLDEKLNEQYWTISFNISGH